MHKQWAQWKAKLLRYYRSRGRNSIIGNALARLHRGQSIKAYREIHLKNQITEAQWKMQRNTIFTVMPLISVVVPLYKTPKRYLDELYRSMEQQSYQKWQLILSDGSGDVKELAPLLDPLRQDLRCVILQSDRALHISENSNQGLAAATGEFITFLDHDDILTGDALFQLVKAINENPEGDVFYSDEDKMDTSGKCFLQPHYKPDYNPFLLYAMNYITHLFVVSTKLARQVQGFRERYNGAQDYDFILRCTAQAQAVVHIPRVLYHWRLDPHSTAANMSNKQYAVEAGREALDDFFEQAGIKALVSSTAYAGVYHTAFELTTRPLVTIVIIDKQGQSAVAPEVYPIDYPHLQWLTTTHEHYSLGMQLNQALMAAKGEYILFLPHSLRSAPHDFLESLLAIAQKEAVGAVGGQLLDVKGNIVSGGFLLGLDHGIVSPFQGYSEHDAGYMRRGLCMQNLQALPLPGMMVKTELIRQTQGFMDSDVLECIAVDFSLQLLELGFLNVYDPTVKAVVESVHSQTATMAEIVQFKEKWPSYFNGIDPYYNPNFPREIGKLWL